METDDDESYYRKDKKRKPKKKKRTYSEELDEIEAGSLDYDDIDMHMDMEDDPYLEDIIRS